MPMTLNAVPQSSQTLSVTQPLILGNFTTIDAAFQVDHVPYNLSNTGDQGKHNQVTFPVQGSAPTFGAGYVGLYNLAYGPTARNEMFCTNAIGQSFPMTARSSITNPGWSYLPSGAIIQFGLGAVGANTFTVITFGTAFSSSSSYQVVVTQQTFGTPVIPTISAGNNTLTATQFTVNNAGAACNFNWIAIGF